MVQWRGVKDFQGGHHQPFIRCNSSTLRKAHAPVLSCAWVTVGVAKGTFLFLGFTISLPQAWWFSSLLFFSVTLFLVMPVASTDSWKESLGLSLFPELPFPFLRGVRLYFSLSHIPDMSSNVNCPFTVFRLLADISLRRRRFFFFSLLSPLKVWIFIEDQYFHKSPRWFVEFSLLFFVLPWVIKKRCETIYKMT